MSQTAPLLRLVYASQATKEMSFNGVLSIIAKSRSANKARNITGMMLYDRGTFLQVLEGTEEVVRALYASIGRDARHHGLKLLLEERTATRLFSGWSMGHSGATLADISGLPGMNDVFLDGQDLEKIGENQVRHILEAFRTGVLNLKSA